MTSRAILAGAAIIGLITGSSAFPAHSRSASGRAGTSLTPLDGTGDAADKHACKGQNRCKGKGGCKSGANACKGKNSCKGKGGCYDGCSSLGSGPTATPSK
jgi:hypothetical protein